MKVPTTALAVLLTCLVALGPLSTDFYLPALPEITRALGTDVAGTQLTLSVFLAGFGAGQLIYGPLSDRFGRRPIMMIGLGIYVLASFACVMANSIEALILARFLQSLGACAGPVLGRTIVRDVYGPQDSARMLSYISAAMALAPLAGPVLGGWLTVAFGWRATFIALTIFSALLALTVWSTLGETNAHPDPTATRARRIVQNFLALLRDPLFRGVLLTNAFAYAGLFAFISGSPFVFIDIFGFSPQGMGLAFGVMVSGYVVGTMISGRLSRRLGPNRLLQIGVSVGACGGTLLIAPVLAGFEHPLAVMLPMSVAACSVGLVMPNATALGLGPYPTMAGSAASLMGFAQMSLGALFGILVGHNLQASIAPMAFAVCAAMFGSLVAWWLWVRPAPVASAV